MVSFLKKYKAFGIAALITFMLIVVLRKLKFILIDPNAVMENILISVFWWLSISFCIYKIPYLKKNRVVAYKIVGLIFILVLAVIVDSYMKIPDNPITLPLIILFWLGLGYLLLPKFFVKYRIPILLVYGLLIAYFLYIRLNPGYFENYDDTIMNLILASIFLLLSLWLFDQWKWLKTLKDEKAKAELASLKNQINPHFFFNTLNNLYGLTVEKSDKAPKVVLKLSDMMRYTIYEGKKDFVPLKDEIAYLGNYIDLHKLRYQKKVDIQFNFSSDKDYKIAPLLFIILLENAFKHGMERLMEDAYIYVALKAKGNVVSFQIENNFEPGKTKKGNGIGLDNLKHRLKLIYPNRHQLSINVDSNVYKAMLEIETI